ncbi:MAG: MerR family transcriptional regulator [Ilumatobacteraceae bacterium]
MTAAERPYLSIGEVLALLLEEFPDVTISKIRFLESQGLIDPERTPSGYRKFYDADVERLRVILREQRENFLPLRVIRDRLENGQIDDSGALTPPRGIRNVTVLDHDGHLLDDDLTGDHSLPEGIEVPTGHHPAAQHRMATPPAEPPTNAAAQFFAVNSEAPHLDIVPDTFVASELCSMSGLTAKQLEELESYGLITGRGAGTTALYSSSDLAIARTACEFLARGVEARHLRGWKQSAEREASLFEQLVLPLVRQRNPQSRQQAAATLAELSQLGADLRASLLAASLRHHLEA